LERAHSKRSMHSVKPDARAAYQTVLAKLQAFGFLLESDPKLPSVCSLITGAPLRTSWWSHPKAHTIFQVNEQLEEHPDVLVTKLISGKVTFVHRELWPHLLAIGNSHNCWQMDNLTNDAKTLLKLVDSAGTVRTDQVPENNSMKAKIGDVARELERKLLLVSRQIHTETGSHAKVIESWKHWCKRVRISASGMSTRMAQNNLEERVRELNEEFGASARLPWT
jgi:hypothetical protein